MCFCTYKNYLCQQIRTGRDSFETETEIRITENRLFAPHERGIKQQNYAKMYVFDRITQEKRNLSESKVDKSRLESSQKEPFVPKIDLFRMK